MTRVYIPAREPEPVWPNVDDVADLVAAFILIVGGCWLVAWGTLL